MKTGHLILFVIGLALSNTFRGKNDFPCSPKKAEKRQAETAYI
jgi:hypothetical protein